LFLTQVFVESAKTTENSVTEVNGLPENSKKLSFEHHLTLKLKEKVLFFESLNRNIALIYTENQELKILRLNGKKDEEADL
jgi:hypothetical protein